MIKKKKRKEKEIEYLFWEFKVCYFSDLPPDVAICHEIIAYKLSLSPKTKSGYLLRKWVFPTKASICYEICFRK